MGGKVGGDPDAIATGAKALISTGNSVGKHATDIDGAGRTGSAAAVTDPMAGAIARVAAAFSQTVTDIEVEMRAAGQLAANAAADLQTAGGGPR